MIERPRAAGFSVGAGSGGGRLRVLAPARADSAYHSRHYRDQHYQNDDYLDVLVDAGNIPAKKITGENHAPDPCHRADDAEREKGPVFHLRYPGDHGRECPYDRHELRENYRKPPITLVELVRPDSMLLVEQQAVFAAEDPRPGAVADEVTA